ncbi:uncharacterized protein BO96DRAFT_351542 [Aspergillus niger CBS 101883]|uniref:Uncharacterized protein n=2 Tax=Aspergillus niger TaxID=5061 RepID=A2R916_ASPNC|nr:uncharacterized protein BO96DRAFT_351542 [Aspergillus niger CBS 101883]XP_059604941.1 hypothetical protein An16g09110 [Aspergillus niger]PYH50884.1 hypothetical protein BO96DRAFT_351542 [Aspergillus niger CBS 101883]CAK47107.1 hypothetical protein An16g09110 [Aspergillus niger]
MYGGNQLNLKKKQFWYLLAYGTTFCLPSTQKAANTSEKQNSEQVCDRLTGSQASSCGTDSKVKKHLHPSFFAIFFGRGAPLRACLAPALHLPNLTLPVLIINPILARHKDGIAAAM